MTSTSMPTHLTTPTAKMATLETPPAAHIIDDQNTSPATPSSPASSLTEVPVSSPPEFNPGTRFYFAFAALAVLTLMVALDGTSISVALPIIARKLHGSAIEAFWAGTSFLLTSTVFQPSFASFSHIFGRKPMVIVAITFFLVGVLIAALSNNFTLLLIGRSLQGIGGGGIIALTEIVVTDLVPLRYRGQWVGIIGGMWAIGSVTGPLMGGAFAQNLSWRWIFYINLPFVAIGYVMVTCFLALNFIPASMASKLRRVDWIGAVVFVGSMTSFLIPLTWGGVMYSWSSWHTIVPLLVGALGLTAFVLYENFVAVEPLIPFAIFANRTTNIAYINTVIHGMILWSLLYYQPLYFEAVQGYTPIISGVALFPATFTVAPSAVVIGFLITKTGTYRWSIWLGWALATLGTGILYLLDVNTTIPQWIFIDLISGLGLGILFPSLQFQLQAASSTKHLAWAVAMFSFFRAFGQGLGVAIGGVIFQNQVQKKLLAYPQFASRAHELAKDAAALVQIIQGTPEGQDKLDLRTAYADSLKTIYVVMCALSGVALILSAFIKAYDLNRDLDTMQGLKYAKKSEVAAIEEGKEEA